MEILQLLKELSEDFFKRYDSDENFRGFREVDTEIKQTRWLGYPPVTIKKIQEKEKNPRFPK